MLQQGQLLGLLASRQEICNGNTSATVFPPTRSFHKCYFHHHLMTLFSGLQSNGTVARSIYATVDSGNHSSATCGPSDRSQNFSGDGGHGSWKLQSLNFTSLCTVPRVLKDVITFSAKRGRTSFQDCNEEIGTGRSEHDESAYVYRTVHWKQQYRRKNILCSKIVLIFHVVWEAWYL